jgi:hypothetical protein
MQEASCYIHLKDHSIYVHTAAAVIHCFKYTDSRCDWELFDDLEQATDWMFKPFDPWCYQVTWDTEIQ